MRKLNTLLKTCSVLSLGLLLSACQPEEKLADAPKLQNAANEKTVDATPASAPADTPQSTPVPEADTHKGDDPHAEHGHTAPKPADIDIDHVFDFAPDDHVVGSNDAKVKMIVYASVTCGHCGKWFTNDWPIVKANYIDTGKVQMAFREIPTPPQQVAIPGFVMANCAPEDQYMEMIVHQMKNQKATFEAINAGNGTKVFEELAAKAGMHSEAEIQACFNQPDHIPRIERASKRMAAAGMQGVPSIIINGDIFKPEDKSAAALSPVFDGLLK